MASYPQGAVDIATPQAVKEAALRLEGAFELAVDVEADSMHAFRARLCFVQVGTDQEVFLFDTLADGVDAHALSTLFQDPGRTKFFHAAQGDLQFLAEAGLRVQGLFDTHRAATLLGWPKVGLADLVRERAGVELLKAHQQSDFAIRPLPADMRDYIADDVRYLCEVGRQVRDECKKADILEEVALDCQRLCDEAVARPAEGAEFRVKLPRGDMAAVTHVIGAALGRELHLKRLSWAEAANVPMGRMLSNAALTEIAKRLPATLRELSRTPNVRGAFVREHGEEVLTLLAELREKAVRGDLVAEPRPEPQSPLRKKREEALKGFRASKAAERKVTPSVVLPTPLLEALASHPPTSVEELSRRPYFGEKRTRLYAEALLAILKPLR